MRACLISALLGVSLALPGSAQAQHMLDQVIGNYEYAQPAGNDGAEAQEAEEERGARRSIPARAQPAGATFVPRPMVQPIPSLEPDPVVPTAEGADYAVDTGRQPVTMYANTAATSASPGGSYTYIAGREPKLPSGARVVSFDSGAWVTACALRLAPEREAGEEAERRYAAAKSRCSDYLDAYISGARSGALDGKASASGEYMMIPVTIMVPQRAQYTDGTPVQR